MRLSSRLLAQLKMASTTSTPVARASAERVAELRENLAEIRTRVQTASSSRQTTLVAVSKYKPASDVLACVEDGQLDFGENYVQELVDKAAQVCSPRSLSLRVWNV